LTASSPLKPRFSQSMHAPQCSNIVCSYLEVSCVLAQWFLLVRYLELLFFSLDTDWLGVVRFFFSYFWLCAV
jgi:hypothetical protein